MDTTVTPSSEHAPTYTEQTDPIERQQRPRETAHIKGWGADADPANRPAYPMERTPPRLDNVHWDAPARQQPHVKIYHAIERPGITPVFGTSVPPRGLSGWMRRRAFRRSESDIRHWMMLLAADRVNVVEGVLADARRSPGARSALVVGGVLFAAWWLRRR